MQGGQKKSEEGWRAGHTSICKEVKEARLHNKTHLVYDAIKQITVRYAPQIQVIKDRKDNLITKSGKAKQRRRQYFDTLYNDPNAVNVDYNEKHLGRHSNTRDNEEM